VKDWWVEKKIKMPYEEVGFFTKPIYAHLFKLQLPSQISYT
jgi:hypothetical protein